MDNSKHINRPWRPKDDGGGGDRDQQQQQQQPQDGDQQQQQDGQPQQQDGGQQGGDCDSGSGGQSQQGGQQGGQSGGSGGGSGQPQTGGKPKPSVTAEDAKKAQQTREQRAAQREKRMKRMADAEGMSLQDYKKKISTGRQAKQPYSKAMKQRKNFLSNSDINKESIGFVKKDEDGEKDYSSKEVEYGANPRENVKKHLQALKEIEQDESIDNDTVDAGWSNYHENLTGEDTKADKKLKRSKLHKNTELNRDQAPAVFDPATGHSIRKLNASFSVFASKIAEDAVSWPTIGDDEWDVYALMKRKYDKRPLSHCKQSREKSRLVLALDTSGSCQRYSEFFSSIAQAALAFGDVEIYEAPNGYITHKLIPGEGWLSVSVEHGIDWQLRNRHIVFFGDWDGAARVIHNSQHNKLYWFDCEQRGGMQHWLNDWQGRYGYTYTHFKGKRYDCYGVKDFMRLVKKIK